MLIEWPTLLLVPRVICWRVVLKLLYSIELLLLLLPSRVLSASPNSCGVFCLLFPVSGTMIWTLKIALF